MSIEFNEDKTFIREAVRQAIKLHKEELVDIEVLRLIAATALLWEITETFDDKFYPKVKKLDGRVYQ
jgi:hypothetical protein